MKHKLIKTSIALCLIITTINSSAHASPDGSTGRFLIRGIYSLFGAKTPQQIREEQQQERAIRYLIAKEAQCGQYVDCYTVTGGK